MFWQKTIKTLREDKQYWKDQYNDLFEHNQARNNTGFWVLKHYHEKVVAEKDSINQALAEENRDLVRKLELYKALLERIKINITLPERKR